MTATPIPRTLGQILHADLDVSDLRRRRPAADRAPASARTTSSSGVSRRAGPGGPAPAPIRSCSTKSPAGHRAFVVVPLVEEDPERARRSAQASATGLPRQSAAGVAHERRGPRARASRASGRPRPDAGARSRRARWIASATASSTCSWARPSSRSASTSPRRRDDHPRCRPLRPRPAPPAARSRGSGTSTVVLRPRQRTCPMDECRRRGPRLGRRQWRRTMASRSPRWTRAAPRRGGPRPGPERPAAAARRVAAATGGPASSSLRCRDARRDAAR